MVDDRPCNGHGPVELLRGVLLGLGDLPHEHLDDLGAFRLFELVEERAAGRPARVAHKHVAAAARLDREEGRFTGPLFADINGDGWLDLVVHNIAEDPEDSAIILYENLANGRFANATQGSGIVLDLGTAFAPAFADIDKDGDIDLFISRWGSFGLQPPGGLMWRNEGDFRFTDISREAGFDYRDHPEVIGMDWSLTPTFTDLNDDGYPDLLLTGEFGTVRIFLNQGGTGYKATQMEFEGLASSGAC